MISFVEVTRQYPIDKQVVVTPVNNVTLEIGPGHFVLVVGRSGSGKTTLLNLAAGLIKPTKGEVLIGGSWHGP